MTYQKMIDKGIIKPVAYAHISNTGGIFVFDNDRGEYSGDTLIVGLAISDHDKYEKIRKCTVKYDFLSDSPYITYHGMTFYLNEIVNIR